MVQSYYNVYQLSRNLRKLHSNQPTENPEWTPNQLFSDSRIRQTLSGCSDIETSENGFQIFSSCIHQSTFWVSWKSTHPGASATAKGVRHLFFLIFFGVNIDFKKAKTGRKRKSMSCGRSRVSEHMPSRTNSRSPTFRVSLPSFLERQHHNDTQCKSA